MAREERMYDSSYAEDSHEDATKEDKAIEESTDNTDNDSILSEDSFHPLDKYTHPIHR